MDRKTLTQTPTLVLVCCVVSLLGLGLASCDRWPFATEPPTTRPKTHSMFERGPKACELACAVSSASKHELSLLFGVDELPPELGWGRPYVDGAGFEAFRSCIGDEPAEGAALAKCFEKAHHACIDACQAGELALIERKKDRHYQRDEARKKAREKQAAP